VILKKEEQQNIFAKKNDSTTTQQSMIVHCNVFVDEILDGIVTATNLREDY